MNTCDQFSLISSESVLQNTDREEKSGLGSSHTAPYETVVPARAPNRLCLILKRLMTVPQWANSHI